MIKNSLLYGFWLLLATANVLMITPHISVSALIEWLCIGVLLAVLVELDLPIKTYEVEDSLRLGFVVAFTFGIFIFLNYMFDWHLVDKLGGKYAKELHTGVLVPLSYFSTLLTISINKYMVFLRRASEAN